MLFTFQRETAVSLSVALQLNKHIVQSLSVSSQGQMSRQATRSKFKKNSWESPLMGVPTHYYQPKENIA